MVQSPPDGPAEGEDPTPGAVESQPSTEGPLLYWMDGVVRDPNGLPVAGATIELRCEADGVVATAETGQDGAFDIYGVGSPPCVAQVSHPDHLPTPWFTAGYGTIDLTLGRPFSYGMNGLVFDALGRGVTGATIELWCEAEGLVAIAETDRNGAFAISAVAAPPCTVEASHFDFLPSPRYTAGSGRINFRMARPPGEIVVVTTDGRTGRQLEGATVAVWGPGRADLAAVASTDRFGVARVPELEPLTYRVTAEMPGYARKTQLLAVNSHEATAWAVEMGLGIEGVVVLRGTDLRIPHASVLIYSPEPGGALGEPVAVGAADGRGYFWFDMADTGDYVVATEAPRWLQVGESRAEGQVTGEEPLLSLQLALGNPQLDPNKTVPTRIAFPKLGMGDPIVVVGVEADGTMAAPTDPDTVGWFRGGAGLLTPGNVILSGHVNWTGQTRLFGHLNRLVPGDEIVVFHADGPVVYRMEWSMLVGANATATDIVAQGPREEITLITCDGPFDTVIREYLGRLIVRAVRVA